MGHEFYSALQDICYKTNEDAGKIEQIWSSQNGIAELLKSILPALGEYKDEFVNNVTDHFCKADICDSDTYWQLYRPLFDMKCMDNDFLNKMAWNSVHEKQTAKLQKVTNLLTAKSEWQADPNYKKMLEEALLIWYEEVEDTIKHALKIVADKFEIIIPDKQTEKEDKN